MRTTLHRLAAVLAVAILGAALAAGAATAAPVNAPNATPITIDCGPGGTFDAITNGNGEFTPAHDLDSRRVLIPVSLGPTTFTARDAEGNVVFEETDPTVNTKGRAAPRGRTLLHCSFTLSFPAEDGGTATVTGNAIGFVSGRR
jgi:hypothetical protein